MSWLDALRHRLRVLGRPGEYDRDVEEEIRFHLSLEAMQQSHAARGGASAGDAQFGARRRFGNPTYIKEERRRMTGLSAFDMARQDLGFALRTFRRAPAFTLVAIVTLALGIGANTAIFSAVNAMLLRPLPFRAPERLMKVSLTTPPNHGMPAMDDMVWSYLKAKTFNDAQQIFASTGLYSDEQVTIKLADAQRESAEVVDPTYLPTLGVQPALGRNFLPEENVPPKPRLVVVISANLWNRLFNADPNVLGRSIDIDNAPYTIVGVLPEGFNGMTGKAQLWTTIGARRAYAFDPDNAFSHEFWMVARLKPGVSAEQAKAAVSVLGKRVNATYVDRGGEWGAKAWSLDQRRVDPMMRRSLLVLLGAVGFVLLIACVNLANLFLVRASTRQREIAVRLAIGAGRGRLVRQLLTESVLLSGLGGIASIAVAWWGVRLLGVFNPESAFREYDTGGIGAVNFSGIRLDLPAFGFAVGATILTGLLFGLVPALLATRPSLMTALKDGVARDRTSQSHWRFGPRNGLVVLEVALALVLLAGSGLMLRSLSKLVGVQLGFEPQRVLTLRLTSSPGVRARDSLPDFYQELLGRLGALPGVTAVALGDCPPLAGGCNRTALVLRDQPEPPRGSDRLVGAHWATPGWFSALRIPLRAGRVFEDGDRLGRRKVVIVSEQTARKYWPNASPLGKPVAVMQGGFHDTAYVVGVVGDVRFRSADAQPEPDVYIPYYQSPRSGALVYLRTAGDPSSLIDVARRTIHELAPDLPVYDIRTLKSRVADATAQARFSAVLLVLFAGAALILAAIGIYGVMSFSVAQRTREIGIRVALGAARRDVLRLVVGQGSALAVAGSAIGLVAALAATRVLRSLLYDVAPFDPPTYVLVVVLLSVTAIIASWIPARRAARVDPVEALRES
jgi:predicted permease